MKLAMYKGPAIGFWNKVAHYAICVADSIRSFSIVKYSHVELVLDDGLCYSSSYRDGGVRFKSIDLASGKWDVYQLPHWYSQSFASNWFFSHMDEEYDWRGIVRFLLPFVPQAKNKYFCSEAVAAMLGFDHPENLWPSDVLLIATYYRSEPLKEFSPKETK